MKSETGKKRGEGRGGGAGVGGWAATSQVNASTNQTKKQLNKLDKE